MPPASNFGQDITNTTPNDGSNDLNRNQLQNIERMGGTLLIPRVAGRGVIKVVKRCDDAKENNELGKFRLHVSLKMNHIQIRAIPFFNQLLLIIAIEYGC